ncbi:MAG: hypothetical protein SA378_05435 [Sedimentibacter sp.]|uniref:hypothetical protein n=1 Tax=Sedimentibacter sp. TaxID=1960295 RepID=UPI0029815646|nr:hypothetical protein [Sedimentibacter sp.]MDW5299564.1 hypothetical protein [Sedimentibacter sp.]
MREYYEIWWEHITGPKHFTDEIMKNIDNELCTMLCVPDNLPWEYELRDVIIRNNINNGKWFEIIDDSMDCCQDAGNYLLQNFAEENIKSSYAYYCHNTTIEKYLKDKKVLCNKILWIKNTTSASLSKWLTFFRKYKSNNKDEGIFILETTEEFNRTATIDVLKYSDFVTIYDAHLFSSIIASESSNEQLVHQYITYLADSLCGMDVELIVEFINNTDFYKDDIANSFRKYSNITDMELLYKIWKAQIQIAFPLVEVARVNFASKYEELIKDCLPVMQFGEIIQNPYEVELGTIIYMLSNKCEEYGENRLLISRQDYEDIHFLHDVRNKLAHIKYCRSDEIYKLLLNNFFSYSKEAYA